ncbi:MULTISPECIES: hypothetical protein [unclassified Luteococcus]|uniref:hypothetical protein n=1 Tax=unclassified Luteococcus TaxID=2639923 RepID=UPI00313CA0A9
MAPIRGTCPECGHWTSDIRRCRHSKARRQALAEDAMWLHERGESWPAIAARFGLTVTALEARVRRQGIDTTPSGLCAAVNHERRTA